MDLRPGRQLGRHGRPQADRDPLHRHEPRVLPGRRGDGAADPDAARDARHGFRRPRRLQPALHDARHDDDLPRRRPDLRRLRELPHPADDRRRGHGLPAAERALLLAVPLRWNRAARKLLRRGGRGEYGLDRLSAPVRRGSRQRPGPLDRRPAHPYARVAVRGDQLRRDDPQHANGGHDLDAPAALRLGDGDLRSAADRGAAGALGGSDDAADRPRGLDALLPPGRGRRRGALPARLLVLRPPRGLHHDPARDGDRLRDDPGLRAQADLRLQGDRLLDGGDRLLLAARLGPPHVHSGPADRAPGLVHDRVADRSPSRPGSRSSTGSPRPGAGT